MNTPKLAYVGPVTGRTITAGMVIGHRKDGRPIYAIAGGDGTDPPQNTPPVPADPEPDPTRLTHKQAINRMKDLRDELERIGAKQHRTPDDDRVFAEGVAEIDVLNEHVRQLERTANLARVKAIVDDPNLGKVVSGSMDPTPQRADVDRSRWVNGFDADPILNPDSIPAKRFRNPWDLSEVRTFGRSKAEVGQELKARALSAIERMSGANDDVRKGATRIIEDFDDEPGSISALCLATSSPEYLRAWSKMARGRGNLITAAEQKAIERAMSLTDSQGGFLVPFQLDPTVIITSAGSLNEIRQAARSVVATGDVWNGVSAGEVQWRWAAEGTEAGDNAPTFAQPTVPVHQADGFVPISLQALADEANVTSEVGRLLAMGKDSLEAAAFATGTGAGQPTGIVTAVAAAPGSLVSTTAANAIAVADVTGLDSALPARYRRTASWLANRGIYNEIRNLDTSGGAGLWVQLAGGLPPQLIGKRNYESEDMESDPNATADVDPARSDNILIFGDFSNYVIADRVGMTVELIPHLFGANRRPTGQRGWYAYYRVGADSVNDDAFRLLRA